MRETRIGFDQETDCPKRLWVLSALSDDEVTDSPGTAPPGLQFHLSRCPSCRALADRLLSVGRSLSEMSLLEPPMETAMQATLRATSALLAGAKPMIALEMEEPEPVPRMRGAGMLRRYRWAAALATAVGLTAWFAISQRGIEDDDRSTPRRDRQVVTRSSSQGTAEPTAAEINSQTEKVARSQEPELSSQASRTRRITDDVNWCDRPDCVVPAFLPGRFPANASLEVGGQGTATLSLPQNGRPILPEPEKPRRP